MTNNSQTGLLALQTLNKWGSHKKRECYFPLLNLWILSSESGRGRIKAACTIPVLLTVLLFGFPLWNESVLFENCFIKQYLVFPSIQLVIASFSHFSYGGFFSPAPPSENQFFCIFDVDGNFWWYFWLLCTLGALLPASGDHKGSTTERHASDE